MTWTAFALSKQARLQTVERRVASGGWGVHYQELTVHPGGHGAPWTSKIVDPEGAALETTRVYYDVGPYDGSLQYEVQPDGAWTWYVYDDAGAGQLSRTVFTPWGATSLPASPPTLSTTGVRAVRTVYDGHASVVSRTEYADGHIIAATEYDHDYDQNTPPRLQSTVERRFEIGGGYLETTTQYDTSTDEGDITSVAYANGTVDRYDISRHASFNFSASNPTWTTTGGTFKAVAVRHELAAGPVEGKSTKEVTITDALGRAVYTERCVRFGNQYQRTDWTAYELDDLGRVTDTYHANGTSEHVRYEDCCATRTVTDAAGLTTTYEYDLLGRLIRTMRDALAGFEAEGASFTCRPEVVTTYQYTIVGVPPASHTAETTTVTSGGVSQSSTSISDMAGRVLAESMGTSKRSTNMRARRTGTK